MDVSFLIIALGIISVATTLTVEALKKILDSFISGYNPTILAAIVSVVLSLVSSICYLIYNEVVYTGKIGVEIVVLIFLSFLCATVGYDKVIKEIFKR